MEEVFNHILGHHGTFNWAEQWIKGQYQLPMSCEIVSIDGYIQLIMRIPEGWRDVTESAIFAQFPDAEITEVEDYTKDMPDYYPNDEWSVWGLEWSFDNKKNPFMPILTYREFEDKFTETFVDPMAGLLESMAKLEKGEQIWLHMVIKPWSVPWASDGTAGVTIDDKRDEVLGRPKKVKTSGLQKFLNIPQTLFNDIAEQIIGSRPLPEGGDEKAEEDLFGKINKLSPGERENLEMMEKKGSKLAYGMKMRFGYFNRHGVGNKSRGPNAIIGAMKQFGKLGRQGFKPELGKTATKAAYFNVERRKAYRQRKLVAKLKGRSSTAGMPYMAMSTEELATIFHFPAMDIRAPMLKRTDLVKAEAPLNLPFEEQRYVEVQPQQQEAPQGIALPWEDSQIHVSDDVEYVRPTFDYDNDEFERRFAVDKKAFEASRPAREARLREIEVEESAKQEIGATAVSDELEVINELENEFAKPTDAAVVRPVVHKKVIDETLPRPPQKHEEEYTFEVIDFHAGPQTGMKKQEKTIDTQEERVDEIPDNLPFV
jgi:hypothetical protein